MTKWRVIVQRHGDVTSLILPRSGSGQSKTPPYRFSNVLSSSLTFNGTRPQIQDKITLRKLQGVKIWLSIMTLTVAMTNDQPAHSHIYWKSIIVKAIKIQLI